MLLAAVLAASPLPGPTVSGTVPLPAPTGEHAALIVNTGSTNTAGYQLLVREDGTAVLTRGGSPARTHLSAQLVARFFADLRAAGDLSVLPAAHCMKSASFGSTTRIQYRGATSPDLSCPSPTAAGRALAVDAQALADAAGIALAPRRTPGS